MRTFIAVELPEGLKDEISRLTGRLKEHLPGVRWSRPSNIHLTLRFLGEIDPGRLDKLSRAVEQAVSPLEPFEVEVAGIGSFGGRSRPRVIWLGLESSEQLAALAEAVERAVFESGFGRADKPFKPHLTLARVRKSLARVRKPLAGPPDWESIRETARSDWPVWRVDGVKIIKSILTPDGPVYEPKAHCLLKG
ncbi:MAG: RNA 2',3'-cyclic phosphodiesterase [Gemmatimonadota bacterium]|nr:RNA 2',3'-cyclic phosphodiesterase [Gemmatimonadota bacterium]